jgi:hypothetical protein
MKKLLNFFVKVSGRIQLAFGFCPWCNSSAPELYDCPVCHYYSGKFPPSKQVKKLWWGVFVIILKESERNG